MDIAKSDVVRSAAGRDKGDLFFVLETEGEAAGGAAQAEEAQARGIRGGAHHPGGRENQRRGADQQLRTPQNPRAPAGDNR